MRDRFIGWNSFGGKPIVLVYNDNLTKKFHWNVPGKWLIVFVYIQIFGFNFKSGDDCFEPRFIYDPIQKNQKSTKTVLNRARCPLAVFCAKKFVVLVNSYITFFGKTVD